MSVNKSIVSLSMALVALFALLSVNACANGEGEKTTPTLVPTPTFKLEETPDPTETPAPTVAPTPISTPNPTPEPTPPPTSPPTPEPSPAVSMVGKEVFTTEDDLRVRAGPSTSQAIVKTQSRNVLGVVTDGPVAADGYIWWKIDYEDGTTGWSAQDWLKASENWPAVTECDFSKPVDLRQTTKYGIFGDDEFDTLACGYLKLVEQQVWDQKQISAYLIIVDYADPGFIHSVDAGVKMGNSVNRIGPSYYEINLGCFVDGKVAGDDFGDPYPYIDAQTQQAILSSSPGNLVSLVLSYEFHPGRGCGCCHLAHKIRLY